MSDKLNLIATTANDGRFSTFTRLMETSNANDVFKTEGPFTVFAPTNDAFAKIPDAKLNELLNETGQVKLKELLSYHILPGKVMAANLVSAPMRKAFTGEELMFTDVNGLKVNNASVQARNFEATNGVVHAIDTVLEPTRVPVAAGTTAPLVTPAVIAARNLAAVTNAPTTNGEVPSASPDAASAATARGNIKSIF